MQVAFVSHQTGTRLRIKVPSKRKDKDFLSSLAAEISGIDGVTNVEINKHTGSILIHHSHVPVSIVETIKANKLLAFAGQRFARTHLHRRVNDAFKEADVAMRDITGNELDIGGAAFLALIGAGIYQVWRGNVTAIPWYAAGWYALNIFLKATSDKEHSV
ncbi:MAG: hypothetical protein C4581_00430 [Nitrospiraceae bacterium]|nr:MAG: hypothetical protein C4581_00430 [Nitrospiraceae bacterium]